MSTLPSHRQAAAQLAATGRRFYARGWVLGTSGNFSAVTARRPLMLAITASAVHKGTLTPQQILSIDQRGNVKGRGRSSAETLLHLEVVRARGAGAVRRQDQQRAVGVRARRAARVAAARATSAPPRASPRALGAPAGAARSYARMGGHLGMTDRTEQ